MNSMIMCILVIAVMFTICGALTTSKPQRSPYIQDGSRICTLCLLSCLRDSCPNDHHRFNNTLMWASCSDCHMKCSFSSCSGDLATLNTLDDHWDEKNCGVTAWTKWNSCSKSCGHGTQKRTREIDFKTKASARCPRLIEERYCYQKSCECPTDWHKHAEHCYFVGSSKMAQSAAHSYCIGAGAYLFIPDDFEEVKFINHLMIGKTNPRQYWIGLVKHGATWHKLHSKNTPYDNVLPWLTGYGQKASCSSSYKAYLYGALQVDTSACSATVASLIDYPSSGSFGLVCEKEA